MFNKQDKSSWKWFIVIYTCAWLFIFLFGISNQSLSRSLNGEVLNPFLWLAICSGGLGSVVRALYSLYWHGLIKQDFNPQYMIYYLVQPVFGAAEGVIVYIALGIGFLLLNSILNRPLLMGSTVIMPLILLSFIAGFRQYPIFWIRKLVGHFYTN